MADPNQPSMFSEVEPGERVVVEFEDNSIAHLGQVDRVLAASDVHDEEYIVYASRNRVTCLHFLEAEPQGFGALLADASVILSSRWPHLQDVQVKNLECQIGTAVALGIEGHGKEGRGVLDRARAFAQGECIRRVESVHMTASVAAAVLISTAAWFLGPFSGSSANTVPPTAEFASLATLFHLAFVGGPLGGLLALTIPRKGETTLSPHATTSNIALTGVFRIVLSIVTSLVVLLAVRAGIAATGLVKSEPGAGYLLVAIAGGFGSNWASNILRAISAKTGE